MHSAASTSNASIGWKFQIQNLTDQTYRLEIQVEERTRCHKINKIKKQCICWPLENTKMYMNRNVQTLKSHRSSLLSWSNFRNRPLKGPWIIQISHIQEELVNCDTWCWLITLCSSVLSPFPLPRPLRVLLKLKRSKAIGCPPPPPTP